MNLVHAFLALVDVFLTVAVLFVGVTIVREEWHHSRVGRK